MNRQPYPLRYRREVDGLRALAVLPVIFFHAGFPGFGGGFVGVDIFFVISGYLITGILLAELARQQFSITSFYERRARRILPALFLVMLACLPFAWLWLLPRDMQEFCDSLAAVALFASNILFWRTSGYFDTVAEFRPLLHTWSLAVEEQFYLFFPPLLALIWKADRRWIKVVLAILLTASLALAQHASYNIPIAGFFLLPTRIWELMIGSLLALPRVSDYESGVSQWRQNLMGFSGILLILAAITLFDSRTPFPGLYALVPTLGAALIIGGVGHTSLVGRILGHKTLVGIGLVSYSAYLWHQPLFAFARHALLSEPSRASFIALAAFSFVLAYFSWKFVEAPFRNRQHFSPNAIFSLSIGGIGLFLVVGLTGHVTHGFPMRLTGDRAAFLKYFEETGSQGDYLDRINYQVEYRMQCNFYDYAGDRKGNPHKTPRSRLATECFTRRNPTDRAVLLWGDSHAQQLYSGLRREMPSGWSILQVASTSCEPRLDAEPDKSNYCAYSNWFAYQTIVGAKPDVVIVAQNLHHSAPVMAAIGHRLHALGVHKVIFTGPTPHWNFFLPTIVAKLWGNVPRWTRIGLNQDVISEDRLLKIRFSADRDVDYLSLIDYFCNADGCLVYYGSDIRQGITTWDFGHLSQVASQDLAHKILVPEILRSELTPEDTTSPHPHKHRREEPAKFRQSSSAAASTASTAPSAAVTVTTIGRQQTLQSSM